MKKVLILGSASLVITIAALCVLAHQRAVSTAGDWPQWCGRPDRNMVSDATGLPVKFDSIEGTNLPTAHLRNVKWVTRLGKVAYGSPVISGGRVFVGGSENDAGYQNTVGVLWCLRESDGQLLWRFRSPFCRKLYNRSWGITSTPTVEGDRVYLLGHLGEVLCLNANGLAGGNTGPFQDEALLLATNAAIASDRIAPNGDRHVEIAPGTPEKLGPIDADIIWRFDMINGVRCWPFNALNAGILIRGDTLYVATCSVFSRGSDDTADHDLNAWKAMNHRMKYESPSLIALDKRTGKLLATDDAGIFEETFHGAHSSPSLGTVHGKDLVFLGGGNGTCYAYDPAFAPGAEGKPGVIRMVWKFDCIAPSTYDETSMAKRPREPVEIISTPVFHKGRVYVAVGHDLLRSGPEAPQGRLVCIDATQTGDITKSGKVWSFEDIHSSASTVAIQDGLLFTADAAGYIYCLDADTGKLYWKHKTNPIWGSPLVADGKVYVPTYLRGLLVFAAQKTMKKLYGGTGGLPISDSPAAAGHTLYVASPTHLYAVERPPMKGRIILSLVGALAVMGVIWTVRRLKAKR